MINKAVFFFKTLNEKQILLLLIGITFGVRLYAVLMAKGIAYDSVGYGFMARDFLRGNFVKGLSPALHPFYPFLISLVSFDSANVEIAGRFVSLFFGTLVLIPVFYLTKEVVNQKAAFFSGLFYSFHPYLTSYSGMLLSEATYWGLLMFSIYCFWTGLKNGKIFRIMISGCFLGLAYLTRPEGIGYLFVLVIWVIIYNGLKREWFKKIVLIGALVLPILILAIPYIIYIHQEAGRWLISKKLVGVQSYFFRGDKEEYDGSTAKISEKDKSAEKNSKILRASENIFQFFPFTAYHYLRAYHFALWLFLFFGLVRVRRRGGSIKDELFLASLVLFHLFSLSTFTDSTIRFSVPIIPISLFWAGAGVLEIQRHFQRIKTSGSEKWVAVLIVLAILAQLPEGLRPERRHRAGQRSVGIWLKENTPTDAILMSYSPIEAFYADREFILLPQGISTPVYNYRDITQFARAKRIRYILINKDTPEMNPDFRESIQPTDLKEFYKYEERDGNMIVVYEVVN